jgi:hypothetical protein
MMVALIVIMIAFAIVLVNVAGRVWDAQESTANGGSQR